MRNLFLCLALLAAPGLHIRAVALPAAGPSTAQGPVSLTPEAADALRRQVLVQWLRRRGQRLGAVACASSVAA